MTRFQRSRLSAEIGWNLYPSRGEGMLQRSRTHLSAEIIRCNTLKHLDTHSLRNGAALILSAEILARTEPR